VGPADVWSRCWTVPLLPGAVQVEGLGAHVQAIAVLATRPLHQAVERRRLPKAKRSSPAWGCNRGNQRSEAWRDEQWCKHFETDAASRPDVKQSITLQSAIFLHMIHGNPSPMTIFF
jgi:hypothetical protein